MTASICLSAVLYFLCASQDRENAVLRGFVEDGSGGSVPGAVVVVRPGNLRSDEDPKSAVSDADGRFAIGLGGARGPFAVEAYAPGHAPWRARDLDPSRPLRIVLPRSGESIAGVVRDGSTLEPIEGAVVETRAVAGAAARLSSDPRLGLVEAVTDGRGGFRLEGLSSRSYDLSASAPGYGRASKPGVPAGEGAVEIYLFPGAGIYGRIAGEDGNPVEAALVSSEATARDYAREAGASVQRSDSEGRFAFLGLEPGLYRLFVLHEDFAPAVSEAEVGKESDAEVDIVLGRGAAVTGRVEDENGEPIAGKVAVRSLGGGSVSPMVRGRLTTETGENGSFSLASVPAGEHELLVEARGYAPENVEISVSGRIREEDLGTIVLEPGRTLHGRVVEESGAPVGDVRVFAFKTSGGMMSFAENELSETFTDVDGRFVLAGLAEGVYQLRARAPGFAMAEPVSAEAGASVTLTLRTAGSIRGVVVDPENRAVTTFSAIARSPSNRRSVGTDREDHEEGVFVIENIAEGEYAVEIQASDFVLAALSGVRVSPGRVTEVGKVRLDRGGRIAGTIIDPAGAPITGASVEVETPGQRVFRTLPGASSDRQGRFEIRGVAEGIVGVAAKHPSYAAARLDRVAVDPRSGPAEVEIVMRRGGAVEGYVRTRDGTDVAGRTVQAVPLTSDFSMREVVTVQTSEDGYFRFDHLPPGSMDVALLSTGTPIVYAVQSKPATVVEGETTYVELVSRKILVQGQVKKGGMALGGVELELWPTSAGRGMSVTYGGDAGLRPKPSGPQYLAGVTNADGFYELLVDEPGEYRLEASVRAVGLPSRTVVVPDADVIQLDLDYGGATVSGRVIDRETELPVAGAYVSARSADPSRRDSGAFLQVGSDGSFALELEPGEYSLVGRAEGYAIHERKVRVGEGGLSDVALALSRGLEVRGRVIDSFGRGVPNLRVFWVEDSSDPSSALPRVGLTMSVADGSFVLQGLPRGTYNLLAHGGALGGFAFAPGVAPGAEEIQLTLRPPGKVEGEVVDENGSPVPAVSVSLAAIDGRSARGVGGQADGEGRFVLAVPAGSLTLRAVVGNRPDVRGSVSVGANAVARIRLELSR